MTAHASDIEQGLKLLDAQKRAQQTRREKSAQTQKDWRRLMEMVLSEHVGRAQRMPVTRLTRLIAKRIHPELSDPQIAKLVDSKRKWISKFLKEGK